MAQVKRPYSQPYRNISNYNQILVFILGLCLGAIIMSFFIGNAPSSTEETSTSDLRLLRQPQQSQNGGKSDKDGKGWHAIHVYYGERSGLKLPAFEEKPWYAQVHQDEILVDLIGENGYFIDLAANDAVELSNTLALEKYHGWKGLCIEPNPVYWYGLSHRDCTVVAALVGGSKSKVQVKFRGVYGGIVGKLDNRLANRKKEPDAPTEDRYTAPIVELLEKFHVPTTIDYLSLDVEGAEYIIMSQFPFETYTIKVMTVERPNAELRTLLERNGYLFLKDLAWWGETLWAHKSTGLSPQHPKIQKIVTEERN